MTNSRTQFIFIFIVIGGLYLSKKTPQKNKSTQTKKTSSKSDKSTETNQSFVHKSVQSEANLSECIIVEYCPRV
jgi:hypothetical protein|tara:strand:+ start:166 stop:387 length:222 start_codon:yes stop_codon:yes gene_type:complete